MEETQRNETSPYEARRENKERERRGAELKKLTSRLLVWGAALGVLVLIFMGMVRLAGSPRQNIGAGALSVAPVTESDWLSGAIAPRVTLVEYSDFECPACAYYAPQVSRLLAEFPNELLLVYRHFPLSQHRNAVLAAYAAEAAGRQGMFFEMHDLIFERQREWEKKPSARELFDGYARELDLDLARFATEFGDDAAREKVRRDTASGTLLRLQGTPSFFLNGALIENPRSYEEWVSLIRNAAPLP